MADTDLIERVNVIAGLLVLSPEQSEALMDAATALAEKDARIVELEAELEASRFAERNGKSLAEDSIHAIRELLKVHDVPVATFIDDHVGNAIAHPVQPGWRNMESAPKDGTEFIALEDGDVYKCNWLEQDDGEGHVSEGWWDHINQSFENPTGWMPLPAAPKGE